MAVGIDVKTQSDFESTERNVNNDLDISGPTLIVTYGEPMALPLMTTIESLSHKMVAALSVAVPPQVILGVHDYTSITAIKVNAFGGYFVQTVIVRLVNLVMIPNASVEPQTISISKVSVLPARVSVT